MTRWAGLFVVPLLAVALLRGLGGISTDTELERRRVVARAVARQLLAAVEVEATRLREFPDESGGLRDALAPGFAIPADPWGGSFRYVVESDRRAADILSDGADGTPGGSGSAADVSARFGTLEPEGGGLVSLLCRAFAVGLLVVLVRGAPRSPFCAGGLAGISGLFALVTLSLVSLQAEDLLALLFFVAIGLSCLSAAIALLRPARHARWVAATAIAVAVAVLAGVVAE